MFSEYENEFDRLMQEYCNMGEDFEHCKRNQFDSNNLSREHSHPLKIRVLEDSSSPIGRSRNGGDSEGY